MILLWVLIRSFSGTLKYLESVFIDSLDSVSDRDFVFDSTQADLKKFDKVIDELEPGNLRMPVLIKKYIKQNAKLVGFNVDPKFNNAIDGLIFLRIADIPESTVGPVMEEFQAELERKMSEENNNK